MIFIVLCLNRCGIPLDLQRTCHPQAMFNVIHSSCWLEWGLRVPGDSLIAVATTCAVVILIGIHYHICIYIPDWICDN